MFQISQVDCKYVNFSVYSAMPFWLFKTNDVISNVSLKFEMLISEICQYILLNMNEYIYSFFQQKISVYLVIKS